MSDESITGDVEGGCPQCGNPALIVPEHWQGDTIVTCPKCGYEARHEDMYPSDPSP